MRQIISPKSTSRRSFGFIRFAPVAQDDSSLYHAQTRAGWATGVRAMVRTVMSSAWGAPWPKALAAFAIQHHLYPQKKQFLQYTTTSPVMHQRLGVPD